MMYGQTLLLPGEFSVLSPDALQLYAFLSHLKSDMVRLHPIPTKNHISNRAFYWKNYALINHSTTLFQAFFGAKIY